MSICHPLSTQYLLTTILYEPICVNVMKITKQFKKDHRHTHLELPVTLFVSDL
jgi:hypothetical protein